MQITSQEMFRRTARALAETGALVSKFETIVDRRTALNIPDADSARLLAVYKAHTAKLIGMMDEYRGAR